MASAMRVAVPMVRLGVTLKRIDSVGAASDRGAPFVDDVNAARARVRWSATSGPPRGTRPRCTMRSSGRRRPRCESACAPTRPPGVLEVVEAAGAPARRRVRLRERAAQPDMTSSPYAANRTRGSAFVEAVHLRLRSCQPPAVVTDRREARSDPFHKNSESDTGMRLRRPEEPPAFRA